MLCGGNSCDIPDVSVDHVIHSSENNDNSDTKNGDESHLECDGAVSGKGTFFAQVTKSVSSFVNKITNSIETRDVLPHPMIIGKKWH